MTIARSSVIIVFEFFLSKTIIIIWYDAKILRAIHGEVYVLFSLVVASSQGIFFIILISYICPEHRQMIVIVGVPSSRSWEVFSTD